jgi:hypothetical protein
VKAVRARLWWLLLGLSLVIILLAIGDIAGGASFEPEGPRAVGGLTLTEIEAASPGALRVLDFKARGGGVDLLAVGVLLALITWFPYRAGERWSWYAMWVLPAWAAAFVVLPALYGLAPGQSLTGPMLSGVVIAAIAAGCLVLDAPRFRKRATDGR